MGCPITVPQSVIDACLYRVFNTITTITLGGRYSLTADEVESWLSFASSALGITKCVLNLVTWPLAITAYKRLCIKYQDSKEETDLAKEELWIAHLQLEVVQSWQDVLIIEVQVLRESSRATVFVLLGSRQMSSSILVQTSDSSTRHSPKSHSQLRQSARLCQIYLSIL